MEFMKGWEGIGAGRPSRERHTGEIYEGWEGAIFSVREQQQRKREDRAVVVLDHILQCYNVWRVHAVHEKKESRFHAVLRSGSKYFFVVHIPSCACIACDVLGKPSHSHGQRYLSGYARPAHREDRI